MKKPEFDYQIRKSARRKTISITVHPDNRIVVSAPASCSKKNILLFVEKKSDWIHGAIQANLQRARQNRQRRFETGEKLLFLGREYILRVDRGSPPDVFLTGGFICVRLASEGAPEPLEVKNHLLEWYVARALDKVKEKLPHYADWIGVNPHFVTIKSLKSRWGSCSVHGRISLAWNIIMAPEAVLDYLVVHELCHMVHHNHSAHYWDLVASILPDHRQSRKWLRENGGLLQL
ncbi:MAG: SprT family zinc-dependent metalloprotease [Syntrophobacteraceae bacterium]